jgi:uncharacterized protein (TIGR02996 family)
MRLAELTAFREISPERTQYWKALLELIARTRDVRTCAALCDHFDNFTGRYYNHHGQARKYIAAFAQHPEGLFKRWPLELSADDTRQLDKVLTELARLEAADPRRALLQAIVDAPGDDEPILIYADWLQGRGDPRGELLVLDHKLKHQGLSKAEEAHRTALCETPCLRGPFEDAEDVFSGKHAAPYELALARALHVGNRVGSLTWRRLARHPPTVLVERVHFADWTVRDTRAEDFAGFVEAATSLSSIIGPAKALEELQPAWEKRFRAEKPGALVRVR